MAGAGSWQALGLGRKTQAAALRGSQAINRAALPEWLQAPAWSHGPPLPLGYLLVPATMGVSLAPQR